MRGVERELGDLLGLLDIAGKENDPAQPKFLRDRPELDGHLDAVEPGHEETTDLVPDRTRRHDAIIISTVRIASSAPTRIDLAGGTIDIWPLYLFHDGASTLNAAISLRAHVQIESRTDG